MAAKECWNKNQQSALKNWINLLLKFQRAEIANYDEWLSIFFLCNRHSSSFTRQMSECCVSDGCRSSSSVLFFSEFFFAAAWSMKNCYCRDLCMHEQTVPLLFVRMDGCFRREMRGKCVKIVFPCRRVWTSWQNLARNEHTQHISSHPSQLYSSFGIN